MPGPVSDSYDQEFGNSSISSQVREAIVTQRNRFSKILGEDLMNIVDVINDQFDNTLPVGTVKRISFTEREMRIIRFALNRSIDTI